MPRIHLLPSECQIGWGSGVEPQHLARLRVGQAHRFEQRPIHRQHSPVGDGQGEADLAIEREWILGGGHGGQSSRID